MKYCSFCGAHLEDGIRFCPECGKPVPEESGTSTRHCRKCGAALNEGEKFCAVCGTPCTDEKKQNPKPENPRYTPTQNVTNPSSSTQQRPLQTPPPSGKILYSLEWCM